MQNIENPVIPGFNPDPSICRVGDTYYLVTSSFEYFPGVPVYSSKNLADWKLIGHCLTRKSQLPLDGCEASEGIFAPTIRCHDGTFFMVTTNISGGGNFIVHTTDPAGEWSEPAWVKQGGIDPSLLFLDDKVYFVSTADCHNHWGIYVSEVNPFTGEMLTDSRLISNGCGGISPEGPHIYFINGYYYLLMAEGGTAFGHMITLQRSRSIYGPYEPCPHNPILSNINLFPSPTHISCTGHGDLFEDQNGNWWIVLLGVRTLCDKRNVHLHTLGRETYLAPAIWKDGWVIGGTHGNLDISYAGPLPESRAESSDGLVKDPVFTENFRGSSWNPEFNFLRNPDLSRYQIHPEKGCLSMEGGESLSVPCISPAWLGVRQNAFWQKAAVTLSGNPQREDSLAGLTVYQTNEHHYDIGIGLREGRKCLILRRQIYDLIQEEILLETEEPEIRVEITSDMGYYSFWHVNQAGESVFLGKGPTAALATEITRRMTFTGCFWAMFAENMTAEFSDFVRENLPNPKK